MSLIGLWFDGQKHFGSTLNAQETVLSSYAVECTDLSVPDVADMLGLEVFDSTRRWLDIYFSGKDPGFIPKLRLIGTPFQIRVWNSLLGIPYGEVATYGRIAAQLSVGGQGGGSQGKTSPRAVGNAVGRNPVSLIVPCHRVTGADGSLTGYAGGISAKRRLLILESSMAGNKIR